MVINKFNYFSMVNLHEVVKIANIINYINVRLLSFVYLITSSTLNIKSQINSNYTFFRPIYRI